MGLSRALKIVINLVNNPRAIDGGRDAPDPRYRVLVNVTLELRARGHTVLVLPAGLKTAQTVKWLHDPTYGPYQPEASPRPDAAIMWWGYHYVPPPESTPTLTYENGFTSGDVVVDPRGLIANSFYVDTLNERVQRGYDDKACRRFLESRGSGWSKRPQLNIVDIPDEIRGKYVFLPTQKFEDLTIKLFSETSVPSLLEQTARFCQARAIPLVVKIHPRVGGKDRDVQVKLLDRLRQDYDGLYVTVAAIGWLMSEALFTVVVNGGTLVDNFYTQTPVLTVAPSLFSATDAVVFDTQVDRGLQTILATTWDDARKLRQRQVACWLARSSLNMHRSPEANIAVIQAHFDSIDANLSFAPVI